jgi:hypothetical protein
MQNKNFIATICKSDGRLRFIIIYLSYFVSCVGVVDVNFEFRVSVLGRCCGCEK